MAEEQKKAKQPGLLKSFIAGGVGGVALVVTGHPLDTIKVLLAVKPDEYTGTLQAARKIIGQKGPTGLFAGMAAPLVGVTPMYALVFFGYGVGKQIFCDDDAYEKLKLSQIGMAGATSALFSTPILAPGERYKCMRQAHGLGFKEVWEQGGIRSLFRGTTATFARDSLASFFYFSTYEFLKFKMTPEGATGPGPIATFLAGGFAGMANWLPALPIDVMKSKLQADKGNVYPNGMRDVFKEIMAKDGLGGFYRGLTPVMLRAFPANAACFLGYETAIKVLDWVGMP
eukprot:Clim_evm2s110 gene=Clim_evmTU2s110